MKKIKELKPQAIRLRTFEKKIIILEVSGEHIVFQKEFGDKWIIEHETDIYKHERYKRRLDELAKRFGFEESELPSLEEYLQTGNPLVLSRDYEDSEEEINKWKPTRDWDSIFLVRRVGTMKNQGMKYEEIAKHFNNILRSLNIQKRVTAVSLRKMMSRANQRLKPYIEERGKREEEEIKELADF